ncbi:MAG: hypothetical protein KBD46_00890 [Candidatus Levybacteria bacterium]|nr:hypothetical protein [Candidatus Levybacteria bacterium]
MKTEKIVISFIAIFIGIVVAGIAFYIYQSTKVVPPSQTKTVSITPPTPTPKATIYLTLSAPLEGEVFDKKVITVSGKTVPGSLVILSTDVSDQVVSPTSVGDFSSTVTIGENGNTLTVTAIAPNGEQITQTRTVTFSTESF